MSEFYSKCIISIIIIFFNNNLQLNRIFETYIYYIGHVSINILHNYIPNKIVTYNVSTMTKSKQLVMIPLFEPTSTFIANASETLPYYASIDLGKYLDRVLS